MFSDNFAILIQKSLDATSKVHSLDVTNIFKKIGDAQGPYFGRLDPKTGRQLRPNAH